MGGGSADDLTSDQGFQENCIKVIMAFLFSVEHSDERPVLVDTQSLERGKNKSNHIPQKHSVCRLAQWVRLYQAAGSHSTQHIRTHTVHQLLQLSLSWEVSPDQVTDPVAHLRAETLSSLPVCRRRRGAGRNRGEMIQQLPDKVCAGTSTSKNQPGRGLPQGGI